MPPAVSFAMDGDLTIRAIAAHHAALARALEESPVLSLVIDPSGGVDLTFVQLVEAARRSAAEAGGELTLAAPAREALLEVLTRGGFLEGGEQREFWLKISENN